MSAPRKTIPYLRQFAQFLTASHVEEAKPEDQKDAARDCFHATLEVIERLSASVPSGYTVRDLLLHILRRVPVKDYLEESKADLIDTVKTCGPITFQWGKTHKYNILDDSCHSFGERIARARGLVADTDFIELAPTFEELLSDVVKKKPAPNGPVEHGVFVWTRKRYQFPPKQWNLIHTLWGAGKVEEEAIREQLGEGSSITSNALTQLQHRTNLKFAEYQLPFQIIRPTALSLRLKRSRALTQA